VVEKTAFSKRLLEHQEARNPSALARIDLAKKRIQSILDRDIVAHRKTLEQKIAEQGPTGQRVDPHLVGLAIMDLQETRRLRDHSHPSDQKTQWYSNLLAKDDQIAERLDELAPLYSQITGGGFGNLTGDALEVITFKCLRGIFERNGRYAYLGYFYLDRPKDKHGRYQKNQPPKSLAGGTTIKEADFVQYGHEAGPLCIECKNYREWIYPQDNKIKELIIKAYELQTIPVMIARRIHYAALTNLLEPAGIISHESYFQYYPADQSDLADRARHARSLGFTDVRASEEPDKRTVKFFNDALPKIVGPMAVKWHRHRDTLYDYAKNNMNISELYTAIGSPAGGKWAVKPMGKPNPEDSDIPY